MLLERAGVPVTVTLDFKGDLKRETRWFAQYGDSACTITAALLLWRLDRQHPLVPVALATAVILSSILAFAIKRLVGRVRPNHDRAGQFLGPSLKHANYRESFPSSHSAAAFAFSAVLAAHYPAAALVFWTLAGICAVLRYALEAHWPSDVFAGVALGYLSGQLALMIIPSLG